MKLVYFETVGFVSIKIMVTTNTGTAIEKSAKKVM